MSGTESRAPPSRLAGRVQQAESRPRTPDVVGIDRDLELGLDRIAIGLAAGDVVVGLARTHFDGRSRVASNQAVSSSSHPAIETLGVMRTHPPYVLIPQLLLGLLAACSDEPTGEPCYETTVDVARCDPATATFGLGSTNMYYPLRVGSVVILEGTEDGQLIRVERRVLPDTQVVAGVTTHVLEARELIDGELYEIARNFYVEASDGTVCYFGEDVEFYENGQVVNTKGSWRAGADNAKPGIIMPASPLVGSAYLQENAPGIALDMGRVVSTTEALTVNGQMYDNVVRVMDVNPLDTCDQEEPKLYVPGIGEAGDTVKQIISYTPGT